MARRLFVQRRSYRQNRLQDAARLTPVLGIVLIFAPIFIRDADTLTAATETTGMETWLVYYFVIWIGLIALTALISRALLRVSPDQIAEPDPPLTDTDQGSEGPG